MSNYTVIDSDNYKAAGIEAFFFSGGEPHVKLPKNLPARILLFLKLRTWNDVGLAVCLRDALRRRTHSPVMRAFIPYFPGARQDRSDGSTPLTASIMIDLLAKSGRPVMFDPHSDFVGVCARQIFMPEDLNLSSLSRYDGVIAPDKGAIYRAESMAKALQVPTIIYAEKMRDFGTGDITHYKIDGLVPGKRYLVVDDICDGGATFNLLAENVPADVELDLWVSHGIFSRRVSNLSTRYGTIYTTNSFYRNEIVDVSQLRVKVLPLNQLFDRIMEI